MREHAWKATTRRAKADRDLCHLALAVRDAAVKRQGWDEAGWSAFKDRVQELDLYIPNDYYLLVLYADLARAAGRHKGGQMAC